MSSSWECCTAPEKKNKTMNRTIALTVLLLVAFAIEGAASPPDSLQAPLRVSFLGGVGAQGRPGGDLYLSRRIGLGSRAIEAGAGYHYYASEAAYYGVSGLTYHAHGLFGEANIFFTRLFYAGVRAALDLNWVEDRSQELFESLDRKAPTFFTGQAVFGQVGLVQPIIPRVNVRVQGQFGLHFYKVAQGALYFDNSDRATMERLGVERGEDVVYRLSLGLAFAL